MSRPQSKSATKAVSLSQEFLRAAAGHEEQALAFMLLSAFGISLEECISTVEKALDAKDSKIIVMMMAAGVQIRGNVTFVGKDYANVRAAYPALVIEGDREVKDVFNFGALHICGHLLAHATSEAIGDKILAKGGDCITGSPTLESDAGKINKEICDGWSAEAKVAAKAWSENLPAARQQNLDAIVSQFSALNAAFLSRMKTSSPAAAPPTVSPPAAPATASTRPVPPAGAKSEPAVSG